MSPEHASTNYLPTFAHRRPLWVGDLWERRNEVKEGSSACKVLPTKCEPISAAETLQHTTCVNVILICDRSPSRAD
jgi:hypothetical protein